MPSVKFALLLHARGKNGGVGARGQEVTAKPWVSSYDNLVADDAESRARHSMHEDDLCEVDIRIE